MKKIYRLLSALTLPLLLAGCAASLDSFDEELDALEERISALEAGVEDLNSNVALLQNVASGYSVSSVTLKDGVYTIVLSNAEEISVNAGAVPVAPAPVLTISDDHYWLIDLQDGTGSSLLLSSSGQKVLASGKDGVVPQFAVDKEGYWTLSYDGETFTRLKNAEGKDVLALSSGDGADKFFSAVSVEGDYLSLTTKDGKIYKAPIVPDFMFSIAGGETALLYNYGDQRQYSVVSKGVAKAVVFAPAGWSARIDGESFIVTAPSSASTKSTEIASAGSEIAVLAMSQGGYSTIAKVKVSLAAAVVPVATVSVASVSCEGAEVEVAVNTMTGLYYKVQPLSDAAPTADQVIVGGTLTKETTINVTGLSLMTSYKIYVVPVNSSLTGSVASASFKTSDYADYLEAWNAGKEITVCGVKYSKALNGEASQVVATAAGTSLGQVFAEKSGVVILEEAEGASFKADTTMAPTGDLVLLSRYPAKPVTVKFSKTLKPDIRSISAKGIIFDCLGFAAHAIQLAGTVDPISRLHFDSCRILSDQNKNFIHSGSGNSSRSFAFCNCYIESRNTRFTFTNFSGNTRWCDVEEFNFINNVVYCPSATPNNHDFSISATNNTAISGTDSGSRAVVKITNNTFYNVHAGYTLFGFNWVRSLNFNRNLVCSLETSGTGNSTVLKLLSPVAGQPCDPAIDMTDNIVYDPVKNWIEEITSSTHNVSKVQTVISEISSNPIPEPDFSNRIFTPAEDYVSYGVQ